MTAPESATNLAPAGTPAGSCAMVIFGASGDLTKRKLVPALYNLARDGLLSRQFAIIGVASGEHTTESFRAQLAAEIHAYATGDVSPEVWEWLLRRIYYVSGPFEDPATYRELAATLSAVGKEHGLHDNRFFYLAVAPRFFAPIIHQLDAAGLAAESNGAWRRVIIEKPFGRDLDSARALNAEIKKVLDERQIYRIDHYLGKETVQNLMVFRFGNGIFEPIWNRQYIDHVQITAAETVGVERRGGYYETSGAMRDMVPNHLFQLVTLTAMEAPISFDADAVRNEQAKVLHGIQAFTPEDVLAKTARGQYGPGTHDADPVAGYRGEPPTSLESRRCWAAASARSWSAGDRSAASRSRGLSSRSAPGSALSRAATYSAVAVVSSAVGTTRWVSPIASASAAPMARVVPQMSSARAGPTISTRRRVPPRSGTIPSDGSFIANETSSVTIRRSAPRASWKPAPMA